MCRPWGPPDARAAEASLTRLLAGEVLIPESSGLEPLETYLIHQAIETAAEHISAGKSLAAPLGASKQFPEEVVEMIAVGEEANNLEHVLINISDNMERRTYRQLEMFVRLLEPILLIFMAAIILFVVAGLLLPVFQSSNIV